MDRQESLDQFNPNSLFEVIPTKSATKPHTPAPETLPPVEIVASEKATPTPIEEPKVSAAASLTPIEEPKVSAAASLTPIEEPKVSAAASLTPIEEPKVSAAAPLLTKPGYVISPSLAELQTMSEEELSRVEHVSICVEEVGKVEWEEPVDLRGLDLDKLVCIERVNGCSQIEILQPEGEDDVVDMKEGEGINHKAKLSFYNVFPKATADKQKFIEFVKRKSESIGTHFVSYDVVTGVWVVRVEHF